MKIRSEVEFLLATLLDDWQGGAIPWQIAVLAAGFLLAWQISRHLGRRLSASVDANTADAMKIGIGGISHELFAASALLLVLAGRSALSHYQPVHLLNLAIPLLLAMVIVRGVLYLLRQTLPSGGHLRSWETAVTWLVWIGMALHIVGLLPAAGQFLEDTGFSAGGQRISLAMILTAVLTVVLTVLAALWLGRMLETRIMGLQQVEINLRFALTKILRSVLVVMAVLVALPIVGIDITVLSVFGGAIGVGIGFGMQKVIANYFSGFIILLDRTVSPGDLVTVDSYYGEVTKLTARCIVVRGLDGTEAIVPNETVITSTVINHSYSNRRVLVRIPVQISYSSSLETALKLMLEAAYSHPRVLKDPAPGAVLTAFADNGINLELMAWIADAERGLIELKSELNLALHAGFSANRIEFPFPQRDIRIVGGLNSSNPAPI